MNTSEPHQPTLTETYISNPFKLAYEATVRFFASNKWWAVVFVVVSLIGSIPRGSEPAQNTSDTSMSEAIGSNPDVSTTVAAGIVIAVVVLLFMALAITVGVYIQGMLSYVALQSEKGKSVSFSEARTAVSGRFWRLLGSHLLAFVKIIGWTFLLIVPGIIAAFRYSLLSYVVMDEPKDTKGIKESHDRIKALTHKRLWEVVGITSTGIIPVVGSLFSLAGGAALYRQFQVYTDKNLEKPKIHWLNYLSIILFIVFMIIGFGIFATVLSLQK